VRAQSRNKILDAKGGFGFASFVEKNAGYFREVFISEEAKRAKIRNAPPLKQVSLSQLTTTHPSFFPPFCCILTRQALLFPFLICFCLSQQLGIFGEWCGPGVQKNVALDKLPEKIFAVFSILIKATPDILIVEPEDLQTLLLYRGASSKSFYDIKIPPQQHVIPWFEHFQLHLGH
jgi:hypothetical protein